MTELGREEQACNARVLCADGLSQHCRVSEPGTHTDKVTHPTVGPGAREKLREALRRLAANDAFVDLLVAELSAVGFLKDGGGSALGTSV